MPSSSRLAGPQMKLIANFGNGVDNIDVTAALAQGITVTNTPGVLTEDTADMTMALILAVARRIVEGAKIIPAGEWAGWAPTWMLGRRISGKRLGIVGMGRIGQALAQRAKAFGLQIHYHNRRPVAAAIEEALECDLLGIARSDARPHGYRFGQLSAHARDLSFAVGAAVKISAPARDPRQYGTR